VHRDLVGLLLAYKHFKYGKVCYVKFVYSLVSQQYRVIIVKFF